MITSALPVTSVHLLLPLLVLFGVLARLSPLDIIFLAEDEQHHVGVLLDRAGFAQIRELRTFVLALFDLAG